MNSQWTIPLWSKKHTSMFLTCDRDMRAFFGRSEFCVFHCMLCRFVSESYWKHHVSSPVIILSNISALHKRSDEIKGELSYLAPLGSENISAPYFKQCFFRGRGYYPPDWVKHHASQSQDRNNKYFIFYIEFVAADLLFRLARMRHAWKGDCYLTMLVFHGRYYFYSLKLLLCL